MIGATIQIRFHEVYARQEAKLNDRFVWLSFKIKMDVYKKGVRIVDLKTARTWSQCINPVKAR